ncbi:MAG: class I SAM-dependent methyltransferase [Ruminococcus sp.]|nr:class I SAM-dependent methyltransferase [Ruminococcus sp.]
MGKFTEYIGSQFGNPRGFVGKCCCVIMNIINKAMYRRIVSAVCLTEHSKALDIGYGNGYLIEQLYKKYHSEIYGIDISEDMKNHAEKRNRRALIDGKLHLETGDCCNMRYDDCFFDAVTSVNTVYFWSDTVQGLKEIHRTLKADGVFCNVVYTKEWLQSLAYTKKGFKFFEREDFIRQGKQAGFTEVSIQEISKGKSFMVIYRK